MTHHDPKDHGHHHGHGHNEHHNPRRKGLHKDWRAWLIVALMLAAMVGYVMTMDESLQPGGGQGPIVPAAPAAP